MEEIQDTTSNWGNPCLCCWVALIPVGIGFILLSIISQLLTLNPPQDHIQRWGFFFVLGIILVILGVISFTYTLIQSRRTR